ncbi:GlsB/YeaQ/YmgE family stress response membrane protein [Paraburkholderia hayleyella]|uniref:GlsB/YeaQ/YmgE family stress response membrane protein n=1 Tax=Paraburkholderia hayleyella TaxID=2152889 RepID=UPI001292868B|nr:GlsB/YeaQ/YmgE family stress response membrane protein [Paraburkholderia hayleyella]
MEHSIIAWLIIGAIAGWLAGVLVKGGGFGLIVDIIVGIVGAFIGGWLAGVLGITLGGGWIGTIITAVIGAVILLFILRLFKRGSSS